MTKDERKQVGAALQSLTEVCRLLNNLELASAVQHTRNAQDIILALLSKEEEPELEQEAGAVDGIVDVAELDEHGAPRAAFMLASQIVSVSLPGRGEGPGLYVNLRDNVYIIAQPLRGETMEQLYDRLRRACQQTLDREAAKRA